MDDKIYVDDFMSDDDEKLESQDSSKYDIAEFEKK